MSLTRSQGISARIQRSARSTTNGIPTGLGPEHSQIHWSPLRPRTFFFYKKKDDLKIKGSICVFSFNRHGCVGVEVVGKVSGHTPRFAKSDGVFRICICHVFVLCQKKSELVFYCKTLGVGLILTSKKTSICWHQTCVKTFKFFLPAEMGFEISRETLEIHHIFQSRPRKVPQTADFTFSRQRASDNSSLRACSVRTEIHCS